jgi:acyl-CoA ligase (AMP-forming) (exosortase A-associated)
LVQDGRSFTYGELNIASNRLARAMLQMGLTRGERVGVFLDHSMEQVFCFYGVSKADGVTVPINSLLLGDQVNHIASDCKIYGLVTDSERLQRIREHLSSWSYLRFIILQGQPPGWLNHLPVTVANYDSIVSGESSTELPPSAAIGKDLACLLYTSGSTGRPKGVMISHDNLLAGANIVTSYLGNIPEDRLLGVLPLSFDYGLNQVVGSALLGMTYVMKSFRFPVELVNVLQKEKITGFAGIPTIWLLLLQKGSPVFKKQFSDLRYISNSGGFLPPNAIEQLREVFPKTRIFLMYGLTEAFRSTYLPPEEVGQRPTSIGKAIPGCEILVVDKQGRLCGPGEVGELVHRGPTVSLGYWGDLEKTEKVFRPNHFLPEGMQNTERIVFSGDQVKKDEEGYLYFVGREDHMIKCYGHRISPSEIEDVLYATGKVKLAAAIGVPDPVRGQSIKLFVVPQNGELLTDEIILEISAEKLPPFMVPRSVEIRSDLPKTPTGKIDLPRLKIEAAEESALRLFKANQKNIR